MKATTHEYTDLAKFQPVSDGPWTQVSRGGICSPKGYRACGIPAGFRPATPDRLDLALVVSDQPARCAGTFTQNEFFAAPVAVCREHAQAGTAKAVVINSGQANAATGTLGLQNARIQAGYVADQLGCTPDEVLLASTGVIGVHLDMPRMQAGIAAAVPQLSYEGGHSAACAIMTTDTHPKEFAISWTTADPRFAGAVFTVGGMTKGSGMIMPNMATMIAIITTDAPLSQTACQQIIGAAVDRSFNRITVDGDTSTNDTCLLLANGAAAPGAGIIEPGSIAYRECANAISHLAVTLARTMAADGEGATKLVTINITGAVSDEDAQLAARTVANSPLVKTALFGHDANWGRIAAAIGRSGCQMDQDLFDIDLMGTRMLTAGMPQPFDEDAMLEAFEADEIVIDANLHLGDGHCTMFTCDFSYDYVKINGDYRS